MKKTYLTALLIAFIGTISTSAQHNTYYIGHSGFGWDLIVGEMVNDLAADAGITTYNYGYQFIGGTCLANQWYNHASPQGGTDSWTELPTGNYDALVLAEQIPIQEVIYGSQWCNSNILTSVQSVDSFYDMAVNANPNTQVYLMEFHNEVDQTGGDPFNDWVSLNTNMRPLWEQVIDSVNLLNTGPDVCIVPVAAAFEAMADSVQAGSFPGITDWIDLFDPNDAPVATIHPTEETYYLVACVHYATIFGQSPVGLTNETYAVGNWAFDPPTPAQAQMMQEIAWEIVSNDPYVCNVATGVEEKENTSAISQLKVYPNPTADVIYVNAKENGRLNIHNNIGQLVHSYPVNKGQNSIDLSHYPAGVYTAQLVTSGLSVAKLIKE